MHYVDSHATLMLISSLAGPVIFHGVYKEQQEATWAK